MVTPHNSGADQAAFGPKKDNTLYEASPGTLSNGSGQHLFVGTNSAQDFYRTLIAFDIAANIPAGATITSAELRLHVSRTLTPTQSITLHTVSKDWGEGASDAPGNEGGGAPALVGDATWVHTFLGSGLWTTLGGDFSPVARASTNVTDVGTYFWSSAQMVADVQGWLDNPGSNHGWLLMGPEGVRPTSKRFDSRENPDASVRPQVRVVYSLPVPTNKSTWGKIKALYR